MDDLKRKVYYLAKDLMTAEKEISRLQKEISGVLQGVERDFRYVPFILDSKVKLEEKSCHFAMARKS